MNNLTLVQFQYEPFSLPLGALYLASGLEQADIRFDLKLYPVYKYADDPDKLYGSLSKSEDIVAIGCWSDMLPCVIAALRRLKRCFPGKTIILGGIGPAEVTSEIMREFAFVDFIIKGCGVYSLPALLKRLGSGCARFDDLDGLAYRRENRVVINRYKGFYLNIPDFPARYYINNIHLYDHFSIFTSVGCPYKCTFCHISLLSPKRIVYRNLGEVIEEIRLIKSINIHKNVCIDVRDESFVINRERAIQFCDLLRLNELDVNWTCYGRIDRMDEELLKIMSENGCKKIFYGVESGSNRILGKIRKRFTIEKAVRILLLSKKYIQQIMASFIYLYPFEKVEDFIETVIHLKYLQSKGISVSLHPLTPVKNSEIYLEYKKSLFTPLHPERPAFQSGDEEQTKIKSSRKPRLLRRGVTGFTYEKIDSERKFADMPKECLGLIKSYPEIFYCHYFYRFKGLNEILRIKNRLLK